MPRPLARTAITVAVACVVVAAACSGGTNKATPAASSTTTSTSTTVASSAPAPPAEFQPDPIDFTACGGRLQCATLRVPLDYANPTGKTIELSVNRLRARKQDSRIGVLLVNPGGPGGSGLNFVAKRISLPGAILDHFDVIGFDPRGVGASTGLPCGDNTVPPFLHLDSAPDTPQEQDALDAAAKAVADDCAANAGDLLPFIGTDDVVRDMDTIRRALGEQQINYLGISYGTLLGLRYAQLFPKNARTIILDGVVDPSQDFRTFLRKQAVAFDKQISAYLDRGGMSAAYDELAQRVETADIPASDGRSLGPNELATAALYPAYSPSNQSRMYAAISSALDGDGTEMLRLFDAYEGSVKFTLYAGVECIDSPHPEGESEYRAFADELRGLSPRFGGSIANELLPCAYWPAPVKNIIGPVAAPGSPPVLVVGNTGDAATPYAQAVTVAATLDDGHLLTLQSDGHGAYGRSSCVAAAEAAYLTDLTLPSEGATCSK